MGTATEGFKRYFVWDRTVRICHWINVICVMALMGVGLVLLNDKALGVSTEGKIALKTIHVYIGYVFVLNLIWRIIWGFIGNAYAKWKAILPFGKQYRTQFKAFVAGEKEKNSPNFLGHNPIARLMVTLLFLLLAVQAATGLVLAGTDLYLPPFGHEIAEWVTNAGEDHSKIANLKPYSKENVDPESYKEMRSFRKPYISLHIFVFYTLLGAIVLHVAGVVFSEIRERSGLVSAMFTGTKVFSKKPIDLVENQASSETEDSDLPRYAGEALHRTLK
ncbi:MAG: cytochrome b/b6 domain-containing protein [Nitrospiria bacterium]